MRDFEVKFMSKGMAATTTVAGATWTQAVTNAINAGIRDEDIVSITDLS